MSISRHMTINNTMLMWFNSNMFFSLKFRFRYSWDRNYCNVNNTRRNERTVKPCGILSQKSWNNLRGCVHYVNSVNNRFVVHTCSHLTPLPIIPFWPWIARDAVGHTVINQVVQTDFQVFKWDQRLSPVVISRALQLMRFHINLVSYILCRWHRN